MKILVVAPRFPFPLDKGDRLTVYHLLKYFSERHEVSLVSFLETDQDAAWVDKVTPFCDHIELVPLRKSKAYFNCLTGLFSHTPLQLRYYADPAMHQAVRRAIHKLQPDLLYAHLIRMGQYTEPYHAYTRVTALNVSMTLNHRRLVEHSRSQLSKLFHALEYHKLRSFEGQFASLFDQVLLISKYDFNAIEQRTPLNDVFFSPHGVDYDYFHAEESRYAEPNTLILTGNMNYTPNVDAALHFYQDILPLVRDRVVNAKLSIVGADPTPEVKALAHDPCVQVTGRVPDLRPYMNQSQIAIAPIRIGAGLQNKVLEGMSMGLPLVVTPIANEGIQAVHQEHLLIADSAQDFADQLVRLLNDPTLRMRLGEAARNFIVHNWSWEKHFADLEQMFIKLVRDKQYTLDAPPPAGGWEQTMARRYESEAD